MPENCGHHQYKENDMFRSPSGVHILKGYWIWWCKKHKQPSAWCEKDRLKEKIYQLENKLKQIKDLIK